MSISFCSVLLRREDIKMASQVQSLTAYLKHIGRHASAVRYADLVSPRLPQRNEQLVRRNVRGRWEMRVLVSCLQRMLLPASRETHSGRQGSPHLD